MKHSDALDQIAPALVKAQSQVPAVHKTASNSHFGNKYAPLDTIMEAALVACHANGISIHQGVEHADDSGFTMVTTLLHQSGQWVADGIRIAAEKGTPQAWMSAVTYSRRGSLACVMAITADDDDDGEVAETPKRQSATATAPAKSAPAGTPAVVKPTGIPKSCPNCGGKVWDNTEKKASGQFKASSPDWSCADSECKKLPGSVGWPEKHDVSAGIAKMKAALDMSRPIKGAKSKAPDFGPDFEEVPPPDEPPDFDL